MSDPRVEEETVENDVMDVEVSLHHEPREVCITVCITEDTESIDLAWFEDKKLNRVVNGTRRLLQIGVRDWETLGTSETVAEVMDTEAEGEDEMRSSKRTRVAERVPIQVPPEVEPENHDFDVNEFLLSSPNPVVASVFWRLRDTPKSSRTPWISCHVIPVSEIRR